MTTNREEAMVKLRAVILSDGCLGLNGRNANLSTKLADNRNDLVQRGKIAVEDLKEFLQHFVVEVLEPLGVKPCSGHPRVEPHNAKSTTGEWLPGVVFHTRNSELLTELYHEYYPDGRKIIPENFTLTGLFLAWFFMLDGNSTWVNSGGLGVNVRLCTEGFDLRSVELFEGQLHKLGVSTGRGHWKVNEGPGISITMLQDSVDRFMSMVDPHVVPPYRYKVKYRGSCPPELAEIYRENIRKYHEQYYAENSEHIKERRRRYYINNRERLNEYQKEYYEDNRERLNEYQKEYQKEYRNRNREHLNKYRREYCRKKRMEKKIEQVLSSPQEIDNPFERLGELRKLRKSIEGGTP